MRKDIYRLRFCLLSVYRMGNSALKRYCLYRASSSMNTGFRSMLARKNSTSRSFSGSMERDFPFCDSDTIPVARKYLKQASVYSIFLPAFPVKNKQADSYKKQQTRNNPAPAADVEKHSLPHGLSPRGRLLCFSYTPSHVTSASVSCR